MSKTKSVTVDIVLHDKAFVQSSELFDTLNVRKDTRLKDMRALRHASQNSMHALRHVSQSRHLSDFSLFNVTKHIFPSTS